MLFNKNGFCRATHATHRLISIPCSSCYWSARPFAAFPLGAIREVVKRKSHGVSVFTSYLCAYLRKTSQTDSPHLSWSFISDLHFLVVLDLRGKLCCEHQIINENIKCFAQIHSRRHHNVLIPRMDCYTTQITFRLVRWFCIKDGEIPWKTDGAKWSHKTSKYRNFSTENKNCHVWVEWNDFDYASCYGV